MVLVTREAAVLVIQLTAGGVSGIFGIAAPAKLFSCVTFASFHFTLPIAHQGLKGIIPTASQALSIFPCVNVNLRAGIRVLLSYELRIFF